MPLQVAAMPDLAVAFLAALVGAGATYWFDIRKARTERRQAFADEVRHRRQERSAVATALLSDLQRLESALRQFYHAEKPLNAAGDRPSLFYDKLSGEVRRFAASNVHPVADFFRQVDDIYAVLKDLRARPDRVNDRLQHQTRCAAGFALQALLPARDALVREGGEIPQASPLPVVRAPELPAIPPPVFPISMEDSGEAVPSQLV